MNVNLNFSIDYVLVGKEARREVIDVKTVQGAEIGSDHYQILLKVKLKARRRTGRERACTDATTNQNKQIEEC